VAGDAAAGSSKGVMRRTGLIALIAVAAVGSLAGAALILRTKSAPAVDRGRGGEVWGADYFPNVSLITQDGRRVRFFDDLIKDKVVAINFIYTTCPDSCPMETARLVATQRLLGDRMGRDVFFYSITIDPEHDTPAVLKRYAASWGIGKGWTLLTGDKSDIIQLRKKLGVYVEDIQQEGSNDHNLSVIIGNQATGRWMKRSPYENPYVLADQLGSWLSNWKRASARKLDYASAPELRSISTGENLWRTRCVSCHTIGRGDVVALAERRVGPDLFDVTRRRDRRWLERWLAEPDKLMAEKDPLALALLAQYNDVPMPNLRLNSTDIRRLLGYIDEESRRISRLRAGMAAGGHGEHAMHRHAEPAAAMAGAAQHGEH
jgi:protein SCO1/2